MKIKLLIIYAVGSTDGKIHCWKTETGTKVVVLNGEHTGPVQSVQFNPKYMMLASACTNMVCNCSLYVSLNVKSPLLSLLLYIHCVPKKTLTFLFF